MNWQFSDDRPIYVQLSEQLKREIITGHYSPGDKIEAVRDLAKEASVNPNTMQRALTQLENEGLVYSKRTSGRFITDDTALIEQLKTAMASEQIRLFLTAMQKLGFDEEAAAALLKQQ